MTLPGFEIARASDAGEPPGEGSEILWMDMADEDLDKDDKDLESMLLNFVSSSLELLKKRVIA